MVHRRKARKPGLDKPRQDLGNSGVQERLQKDLLYFEVLSA